MRTSIPPPIQLQPSSPFSLSPDGRYLAFTGAGPDGIIRIWVHSLDGNDERPVTGTEKVSIAPPFWSPDSRFIAYGVSGQLWKVSISGGAPQPLCQLQSAVGGAWNDDGVIVVGNSRGGLMKCSASGGAPDPSPSRPHRPRRGTRSTSSRRSFPTGSIFSTRGSSGPRRRNPAYSWDRSLSIPPAERDQTGHDRFWRGLRTEPAFDSGTHPLRARWRPLRAAIR